MAPKGPSSRLRNTQAKTWTIPGYDDPFVQDPLTFYEKNEFFGLVGRAVEEMVMTTGDVTALLSLFGMSDETVEKIRKGEIDVSLLDQLPYIVGALSRLLAAVPGMLMELHLLALSVPPEKQREVRDGLRQIDDDTGFGITQTFVEQNIETMRDFLPRWRDLLTATLTGLSTTSTPDPSPTSNA